MTVWIENPFDNLPLEGFRPQRFWLMAEAFARAGHDVTLWTADFNHTTKRARRLDSTLPPPPFAVRLVPTRPYAANVSLSRIASHRAYAAAWERLAFCAGAAARPDVLIVSSPPLATGEAACRLARAFGARLVADIQDAWPETFYRLLPAPLRRAGRLIFLPLHRTARRLYRSADLVTGVCDRYRPLVRAAGARAYERFYLGIDLPPAPPPRQTPACAPRLVYAGNLGRSYDLSTVIAALPLLAGATLAIAGQGDADARLRAEAAKAGVRARVRFHGYLGREALQRVLAEADVGIVPMSSDSFVGVPNKICDYAAAGLAVVSSLGGESADLLSRYGAGALYAPGDPRSLADAVRSLSADAGVRARRMAEAEFDAGRLYDGYVRAIERLTASRLRPASNML
jgi:glycosyltransferase involved in cell wall biosynthesis